MAGNIKQYEAALAEEGTRLASLLRSGTAGASMIAVSRRACQIMAEQLKAPNSVLAYDKRPANKLGLRGADLWRLACATQADAELNPQYLPPAEYARKFAEYVDLGKQLVADQRVRQHAVVDKQNGVSYLIHGERPIVGQTMALVASELLAWFKRQPNSRAVMTMSAQAGLATLLSERPDLVVQVRMAQEAPLDSEVRAVPIDRPAVVEIMELAIGLIPYVGNAVAAYEAYAGRDLFGYKLTDVERGILAATVLLPIAGRLVKGGRILYTEARLVSLYGKEAAGWSKVVSASGRAETASGGKALREVEQAGTELRAQKQLVGQAAKDAASAIPAIVKGSSAASSAIDPAVTSLLGQLQKTNAAMKSLDAPALLRVLEKGPNVDHLKGQLLEELIESQLVPWLRTRVGEMALGLKVPVGKQLEFIPGHMVRDLKGRQISDGILAFRSNGELHIVAIFEAKAGKNAARELSLAKGSMSSLTQAEKAELRANAKDVWRDRKAEAKLAGQPFSEKVEDIMAEYALSEQGGQVRRDIERLAPSGGKATLRVGSERLLVNMSPTQTKFFGVVPRNVALGTIEAQLKAEKVTYEMLAVDIKDTELKALAEKMQALAGTLAVAPP
jgi:putative toxin of predicted polymorphic toxin system